MKQRIQSEVKYSEYMSVSSTRNCAMDIDSKWKYSRVCCCCLNKPDCTLDIYSEYFYSGHKEVYEVMLKDTFNIKITNPVKDNVNHLICEECVSQLRISSTFKHMVQQSERTIKEYLDTFKNDKPVLDTTIKEESLPSDITSDIQDIREDSSYSDDEVLADFKLESARSSIDDYADVKVVPEKRKCQESRVKLKKCKIKREKSVSDRNERNTQRDWSKIIERRGNGPLLRENSLKLLANSTICVFQWNKSRYRCFCCKEPFSDLNSLRDHTNNKHALQDIEKKIINQQNRLVKVEVSIINCKLCLKTLDSLTDLKQHLRIHGLTFVPEDDLLVPFKINGQMKCQICLESFNVFRLLNMHMNKHYQKHVCHICGTGFSNLVFLNLHKTRNHRPLNCKVCDLVFTSRAEKKGHDVSVHALKVVRKMRFPCPYCNERFYQENFRVQHLVEKHGMMEPKHRCSVCDKVFITRSLCNNHVKKVHMKEKNHECIVCNNLFYSKSDLVRHSVTHTGEKNFSCQICNSPFTTKDSMRRHMKRTHVGIN